MSKAKKKPTKNRQKLTVTVISTVTLDLDKSLLPDDEWRSHFYDIRTMEEVAKHVAYNIIANRMSRISQLDGFADRAEEDCKILNVEHEVDEVR